MRAKEYAEQIEAMQSRLVTLEGRAEADGYLDLVAALEAAIEKVIEARQIAHNFAVHE